MSSANSSLLETSDILESGTEKSPFLISLSASTTILFSSLVIATLYNVTLWRLLFTRLNLISIEGALFCLLLLSLIGLPVLIVLLFFGHKHTLKPLLYFFILLSCFISWFNKLGVVIDEEMIRNVFQTNSREAFELLNIPLVQHVFVYAVLPLAFIYKLRIRFSSLPTEITWRVASAGALLLIIFLLTVSNFKFTSYFGRENRDLRLYINPGFTLLAFEKSVSELFSTEEVFHVIGEDAHQLPIVDKKRVGIIVVGETARADHFSLNGYSRETNPELSKMKLLNFKNMSACGTSTAYSVPCMFSFLDASNYSPRKADNQSNLLDVLEKAGVKTIWRDNNSSCKGVCKRIESLNFREDINPDSIYYHEGEYFDEVLLSDLDKKVNSSASDVLIVFHQLGSHGPAYHRRYPEKFAKFSPACESNSPHTCTNEEVNNSYDNTILYTDHFLARTIEFLKRNEKNYESFMIYASDHGESLGEDGVYLHGLPLAIAPEAQTHVPMIIWLSDSLRDEKELEMSSLEECQRKPVSHDVLVHSVLSLFDVESHIKRNDLDIFGNGCFTG